MSTGNIIVPKGDKGFVLSFTCYQSGGSTVFNLTDYAVKFKVWKESAPEILLVSGSCVIVSAPAGTCSYTVASTDFPTAGEFLYELEATQTGIIVSFQSGKLTVTESG